MKAACYVCINMTNGLLPPYAFQKSNKLRKLKAHVNIKKKTKKHAMTKGEIAE